MPDDIATSDLAAAMRELTRALQLHASLVTAQPAQAQPSLTQPSRTQPSRASSPVYCDPAKQTMRHFDRDHIVRVEKLTPQEIKGIREKNNVSQTVFATYLNVSKNLISDWERGVKTPGGVSLRLLTLVRHKGLEVFNA